jgi:uncharacterized protein (DUF486 family)
MRQRLRDNGLGITFGLLFLGALIAQALVGHADFNAEQLAHSDPTLSLGRYVTSSEYWVDVMENWQSEYLQFTLFIYLTVWLVQRGSPESKAVDDAGAGSEKEERVEEHAQPDSPAWAKAGGWRTTLLANSLVIVMGLIFLATWCGQAVTGRITYNAEQLDHQQEPVSLLAYVVTPDFWNRTLQNWQSEFLAVGSMAVLAIYLRQRGSPESKRVGAPHHETGS